MPFYDTIEPKQKYYTAWFNSIFAKVRDVRPFRAVLENTYAPTPKSNKYSQCQIAMSKDGKGGGDVCINKDCICYICNKYVSNLEDTDNPNSSFLKPQCEHILPFMTAIRFS